MRAILLVPASCLFLLAACETSDPDPPLTPDARLAPAGAHECPAAPDFVVTDEAELNAALAAAGPGDVIAIDGTITVTAEVVMSTPEVTLTCATPGSGLFVSPPSVDFYAIVLLADGIAVERLVVDARHATFGAFFAFDPSSTTGRTGLRVAGNRVTCGGTNCLFFIGSEETVIAGNSFTHPAPVTTGLHLQEGNGGRTDGTRVERNTIVAEAPQAFAIFGGIRVRDGSGVVVQGNVVRGPWFSSIALDNLEESVVAHNVLVGARTEGLTAEQSDFPDDGIFAGNVVRNNRVRDAGQGGMRIRQACGNTFVGNELNRAGGFGAVFEVSTGANTLRGNGNVVFDDGDLDCDGDGVSDPNSITGHGPVKKNGPAGVGAATSGSSGLL